MPMEILLSWLSMQDVPNLIICQGCLIWRQGCYHAWCDASILASLSCAGGKHWTVSRVQIFHHLLDCQGIHFLFLPRAGFGKEVVSQWVFEGWNVSLQFLWFALHPWQNQEPGDGSVNPQRIVVCCFNDLLEFFDLGRNEHWFCHHCQLVGCLKQVIGVGREPCSSMTMPIISTQKSVLS